ncbi:MAG: glycoside hydrolase family 18 protein [bacterium]|nr:glycoside hydrolase family 18 protein [bacterium]
MILGGWTQDWTQKPDSSFSYVMYGMVTNLEALTTGGLKGPGDTPPDTGGVDVIWTYGGQGCSPANYPKVDGIAKIVGDTDTNKWDGVDFDDECKMNTANIISAMKDLKDAKKTTSYTFLAGWEYNNVAAAQTPVKDIAASGYCDRLVLMCYGDKMWNETDIENNVGPAIEKTIGFIGDSKKVILALTPIGLDSKNLGQFLNYTTKNKLGGLFIWEFPQLKPDDLKTIIDTLK